MSTSNNLSRRLKPKLDLVLELEGGEVLNSRVLVLLHLVEECGSILAASKAMGIPYSSAWELISKAENILGVKLLERKRGGVGGGGAKLTEEGKALLRLYRRYMEGIKWIQKRISDFVVPDLHIVGSHDPLLGVIARYLESKRGLSVEISWVGSAGGLSLLMIGEGDVATSHLYDPQTRTYNITYLRNYWLEDRVVIVRGYQRELVLGFRPELDIKCFLDVVMERYRFINRNLGSGTRMYIEYLIEQCAKELGTSVPEIRRRLIGYDREVRTHEEVARAVANGEADVGVLLRYVAEKYGLKYIHLTWEWYDFVIPIQKLRKEGVEQLIEFLKSSELEKFIRGYSGYRVTEETGNVVYRPK